ncbi:tail fiber domain-containing protein [Ramlibacter albus]|uniref:Tail fiber domain-containing protein n=1 Tax=Ramlibacter albus TaxID=2079448 RepID=A0A923S2B4_9BURK|nr:tail fiber domain-containing protein [Ramlibacter albus]MBC5765304.1 tail fiber domain-containing protein [Ramlibacter albus]
MKDVIKLQPKAEPLQPEEAREAVSAPKGEYSAPKLKLYGAVTELTAGSNGPNTDVGGKLRSDRRVKQNIVRVGDHRLGFGVYLFEYMPHAGSAGTHFGVMADEVEPIVPHAVSTDPDGFKRVDYAVLGIRDFGGAAVH